jgi:hypothetical protein
MRLVGSVSDALGNLLRCNASLSLSLSLSSFSSLPLSLLSVALARLRGRSPGRRPTLPRVRRASSRPSVFRQSVRSVRATARRPPVRPSVFPNPLRNLRPRYILQTLQVYQAAKKIPLAYNLQNLLDLFRPSIFRTRY